MLLKRNIKIGSANQICKLDRAFRVGFGPGSGKVEKFWA